MMTERQRIVRACRRVTSHPGFGRAWFDVVEVLRHLLVTPTPLAVLESAFPHYNPDLPFKDFIRLIANTSEPLPPEPPIEVGQTWVCVMADGGVSRPGMHVTVKRLEGDTVRLSDGYGFPYGVSLGGLRLYFDLVPNIPNRQETTMATKTESSGPWWTSPESAALARWVLAEERFRDPAHLTGEELKALGRAANNYPSHLMEKGWGGDHGTWNERAVCVLEAVSPPVVGQRWVCTRTGPNIVNLGRVLQVRYLFHNGVELRDDTGPGGGWACPVSREDLYRHFRPLGPDETFSVTPKGTFLSPASQARSPVDAEEIMSRFPEKLPPRPTPEAQDVQVGSLWESTIELGPIHVRDLVEVSHVDTHNQMVYVSRPGNPPSGYSASLTKFAFLNAFTPVNPPDTRGQGASTAGTIYTWESKGPVRMRTSFTPASVAPITGYAAAHAEMLGVTPEQYRATRSKIATMKMRKRLQRKIVTAESVEVDLSMSRGASNRTIGRDLPYEVDQDIPDA